MTTRLSSLNDVAASLRPNYDPKTMGIGIVHLGMGSFHKAHQAVLTDKAIGKSGGNWRILGISLRSARARAELEPQNGLYTLLVKNNSTVSARVIASVSNVIFAKENYKAVMEALVCTNTKIVSLTVTEKAYGFGIDGQGCNINHPSVSWDINNFDQPKGVLGILVKALSLRRLSGTPPFTVLCCDNLPNNGKLVASAVIDFANVIDPVLAKWIKQNTAFPSTMVDRITPAPTQNTLLQAKKITGCVDLGAVETEPFYQWIIEDNFPQGRPDWEEAGAVFTNDVSPFETMKLRMLNGSHSLIAYAGFHCGYKYVYEAMTDDRLQTLVRRYIFTASQTLSNKISIDYAEYARSLIERFSNKALKHKTLQIAMDGSQKIPLRILFPLEEALNTNVNYRLFAFTTAAWLRHISGSTHDCNAYELTDPLAQNLSKLNLTSDPEQLASALYNLGIIQKSLLSKHLVWEEIFIILQEMLSRPMKDVIYSEAT